MKENLNNYLRKESFKKKIYKLQKLGNNKFKITIKFLLISQDKLETKKAIFYSSRIELPH
jgi:hypothetical protein